MDKIKLDVEYENPGTPYSHEWQGRFSLIGTINVTVAVIVQLSVDRLVPFLANCQPGRHLR